jgi:ubiquinone/menaquinone biosynthesis C-methylase UbiE
METNSINEIESSKNNINENQEKNNKSQEELFESLNPQGYAKKEYWNERFNNTDSNFDWYADWEQLSKYFIPILIPDSKILMVGCGNSKMSNQMFLSNYKHITNIDISDIVIQKMKAQYPEMEWIEMDATKMAFEDNSFDCVIDKGTLDAIMCGNDPLPPANLIKEMFRVTKKGGNFCIITHGEPETRLKYFEKFKNEKSDFEIKYETINLSFMANLINSIRNKSEDHTIKGGLKNKNQIIASVLDAFVQSYKDAPVNEVDEKTKKKVNLCMKVQAMIEKYSKYKDKNKIREDVGKESINKYIERKEEEKKKNPNNIRRTHCYLYIMTKK